LRDLVGGLREQIYQNELQAVNSPEHLYQVLAAAMICMGLLYPLERGKRPEK
jgi:hypothetical protein